MSSLKEGDLVTLKDNYEEILDKYSWASLTKNLEVLKEGLVIEDISYNDKCKGDTAKFLFLDFTFRYPLEMLKLKEEKSFIDKIKNGECVIIEVSEVSGEVRSIDSKRIDSLNKLAEDLGYNKNNNLFRLYSFNFTKGCIGGSDYKSTYESSEIILPYSEIEVELNDYLFRMEMLKASKDGLATIQGESSQPTMEDIFKKQKGYDKGSESTNLLRKNQPEQRSSEVGRVVITSPKSPLIIKER